MVDNGRGLRVLVVGVYLVEILGVFVFGISFNGYVRMFCAVGNYGSIFVGFRSIIT